MATAAPAATPEPAEQPAPGPISVNPSTGAVTVRLSEPIKIGGVDTTEITLRRPFGRDFRATFTKRNVEECSMQQLLLLMAAKLAGLSDDELDLLTLADTIRVLEVVDSFQQAAPIKS
ncbi:phage tail assembly protein [Cyanobium sp. N5-Cardenillas]|uniref:phage tail assembly protein n=1 Tax=Cyanobium sp. N5-Cardenillas TaxID=2823720 RepID=UPI0020CEC014|nr:phage tail assembly protein [Cyanobium sp. N5-Cardenillas]MCP9785398.1 phage tail assembly protein [Cyanobium sp. N5-Cardenillas]